VGGSVATKELFGLIGQHFPNADLVHGYGSTESGPHTMALRGREFVDHYGSLGLPVPGNEVRLVDSAGHDVAVGEIGELLVRSDTVMDGYYRRAELTRATLSADGWLATGDLLRKDTDGYFHLAGRAKELIISGGENVYPQRRGQDLQARAPPTVWIGLRTGGRRDMTSPAPMGVQLSLSDPDERGVAELSFGSGRPANAFTLPLVEAFLELVGSLPNRGDIRVLVLRSATAAFSGGADLSAMGEMALRRLPLREPGPDELALMGEPAMAEIDLNEAAVPADHLTTAAGASDPDAVSP
jgi:hypothetical protein